MIQITESSLAFMPRTASIQLFGNVSLPRRTPIKHRVLRSHTPSRKGKSAGLKVPLLPRCSRHCCIIDWKPVAMVICSSFGVELHCETELCNLQTKPPLQRPKSPYRFQQQNLPSFVQEGVGYRYQPGTCLPVQKSFRGVNWLAPNSSTLRRKP